MKFEDPYKILELMAKPNPQLGERELILDNVCVYEKILKSNGYGYLRGYLEFFRARIMPPY